MGAPTSGLRVGGLPSGAGRAKKLFARLVVSPSGRARDASAAAWSPSVGASPAPRCRMAAVSSASNALRSPGGWSLEMSSQAMWASRPDSSTLPAYIADSWSADSPQRGGSSAWAPRGRPRRCGKGRGTEGLTRRTPPAPPQPHTRDACAQRARVWPTPLASRPWRSCLCTRKGERCCQQCGDSHLGDARGIARRTTALRERNSSMLMSSPSVS